MELQAVDPNHEIILESMRRQARSSFVLKRHDDLHKQCQKEMSSYDRAKRLTAAECRRAQIQHLNRLKTLLHYSARQTDRRHSRRPSNPSASWYDVSATERRPSMTRVPLDDVDVAVGSLARRQNSHYDCMSRIGVVGSDSGNSGNGGDKRRVKSAPSSAYSFRSSTSSGFTGRERFLFRVLYRNGKEVYIRDESEARESRELLNGVSSDDDFRSKPVHRIQSGRP